MAWSGSRGWCLGTYTVRENPVPDGYSLTTLPNERTFTIISGEELVYEDGAAMLPDGDQRFETNLGDDLRWGNTQLAMLGDFVWEDLNANGIQEADEREASTASRSSCWMPTVTCLQTTLTGAGTDDPTTPGDESARLLQVQRSDAGRRVRGDVQQSGSRSARTPTCSAHGRWVVIRRSTATDPCPTRSCSARVSSTTPSTRVCSARARSTSSAILDVDGDGVQDQNEGAFPDEPGKTFELLDENGEVIESQMTMDGMVWFTGLVPGTYTVQENPIPDGYSLTTLPNARTFTIISGQELVYEDGAAMLPDGDQRFETNIGDELDGATPSWPCWATLCGKT